MDMIGQLHVSAILIPRKEPRYHWIQGWMGPTAGLDTAVGNRKVPAPVGNQTTVVQPEASHYTD
jgi:hypothetical protein